MSSDDRPDRPAANDARLGRASLGLKFFVPVALVTLLAAALVAAGMLVWQIRDAATDLGSAATGLGVSHDDRHSARLAGSAARLAATAPSREEALRLLQALPGDTEALVVFAPGGTVLLGTPSEEFDATEPIMAGPLAGGRVAVSSAGDAAIELDAIHGAVRQERNELLRTLVLASLVILVASLLIGLLAARTITGNLRRMIADTPRAGPTGAQADRIVNLNSALVGLREELSAMRVARRFLEQVLDQIQEGVLVCEPDGNILEANRAAATLLGREPEELTGENFHEFADQPHPGHDGQLFPEGNARLRTASGESVPVTCTTSDLVQEGKGIRTVVVLRSLAREKQAQKRIRYLTRYDTLTRVPNRMEFQHRLQQALSRARRAGSAAALLYVDVDRFKEINDRLGHPIGDRSLEITARRLVDAMPPDTLVGRLGGDEFAVLLEGVPAGSGARAAVATAARQLLDAIAAEFHVEGHAIMLTASIGITLFPGDGDNVIDLIRNADAAMYHAKQNGGSTYGFYAPEMNADAVERLMLKNELRRAMERNEFQLLYQPKVDLRDGRVAGAEALLRWQHTRRGEVPPSVFIPLAEESSLIFDIGEWVLDQVCTDFSRWQRHVPWPGRVAVNLSLRQLRQGDFVRRIEGIFESHQLPPSCVEFEITESTLADNGEKTLRMLDRLYRLGLHLSIDDFGTGYSSLSSLQHFPIGTLKIDRSFVGDAMERQDSRAIVTAILGLGKSLGMDVVAEGVETVEQAELLKSLGCHYAQGHLFGAGLDPSAYLDLLDAQASGYPMHDTVLGTR
ncbi:MAG: EAL domain-containing protein [Gammaproteobacteria bacterium]